MRTNIRLTRGVHDGSKEDGREQRITSLGRTTTTLRATFIGNLCLLPPSPQPAATMTKHDSDGNSKNVIMVTGGYVDSSARLAWIFRNLTTHLSSSSRTTQTHRHTGVFEHNMPPTTQRNELRHRTTKQTGRAWSARPSRPTPTPTPCPARRGSSSRRRTATSGTGRRPTRYSTSSSPRTSSTSPRRSGDCSRI